MVNMLSSYSRKMEPQRLRLIRLKQIMKLKIAHSFILLFA